MGIFDFFKSKKDKSEKDIPNNSELRIKLGDLKDIGIISHYKEKPFTGIAESYYKSGQLNSETNYKNGLKDGKSTLYYESGAIKTVFNNVDDRAEGKGTRYYESGAIEAVINFVDDKVEGKSTFYNESGQLNSETNYKNGLKDGKSTLYYESGAIKEVSNYVDDKKEGKATLYYESGEIEAVFNYVDDKREGKATLYYESGEIEEVVNYVDGKKEGKATLYYKSGEIEAVVNYVDGKLIIQKTKDNIIMSDYLTIYSVVTNNIDAKDKNGKEIQYYRTELRDSTVDIIEQKGEIYKAENYGEEFEGTLEELTEEVNQGGLEADINNIIKEGYVVEGKISEDFDENKVEMLYNKWYGEIFYKDLDTAEKEFKAELKAFED